MRITYVIRDEDDILKSVKRYLKPYFHKR